MNDTKPALRFSVPLTHSDWMLRETPGAVWGPEGVKYMLDTCKACGWTTVHWRVFDGGKANYKSRLVTPGVHMSYDNFHNPSTPEDKALAEKFAGVVSQEEKDRIFFGLSAIDYSEFDSLKVAVEYGHEIGLQVFAWVTINEDDHGWGARSDFSFKYPEYRWRKRNGDVYRSQMSFAYPEVMEYKLALMRELVEDYAVDGLFIDWIRTGDVRDDPQSDEEGVADRGYEEILVKSFRDQYGVDPLTISNGDERWVRHRAEPHTEFMRKVRELTSAQGREIPVSVLVYHPWAFRGMQNWIDGNLRGMHLDVKTWAREGLIDEAIAAGYFVKDSEGTPEKAVLALKEETGGKVDIGLYAWVPEDPAVLEENIELIKKHGHNHILFWEADYIDAIKNRDNILKALKAAVS